MKLVMQSWRSYLKEAEDEAALDKIFKNAFNKILKIFGSEVKETAVEVADDIEKQGDELNEAGALFVLGLTLAAPAIIGIFTRIAKLFGNSIEGWTGKELGVDKVANKVLAFAHDLHHSFAIPIDFFVEKVLRISDPTKRKNATDLLYTILVAFLMTASGAGAAKAWGAEEHGLAGVEAALAAVKGGEVTSYLKSTLKQIAGEGIV